MNFPRTSRRHYYVGVFLATIFSVNLLVSSSLPEIETSDNCLGCSYIFFDLLLSADRAAVDPAVADKLPVPRREPALPFCFTQLHADGTCGWWFLWDTWSRPTVFFLLAGYYYNSRPEPEVRGNDRRPRGPVSDQKSPGP